MTTVKEELVASISSAGQGVDGDESPAVAILWPDPEGAWSGVVDDLRTDLTIVTLGEFDRDQFTGPAIWIRTVIAGLDEVVKPDGTPVVYMPGVSRDEFRDLEDCPEELKPLGGLQFRGAFWSQKSGRDWTPSAYLQNAERGIGVAVKSDQGTQDAIELMLPHLLDRSVEWLRQRAPIDSHILASLVQPDPVRTLLLWMADPEHIDHLSPAETAAFEAHCVGTYGLAVSDGPIEAARLLAHSEGSWKTVWQRFRESPSSYEGVVAQLRAAGASGQTGFVLDASDSDPVHAWPQHNEQEETNLRSELASIKALPRPDLVSVLRSLDEIHRRRRLWVWADLGMAPLAQALSPLIHLVDATEPVASGSVEELVSWYSSGGWTAEDALMRSLSTVQAPDDREVVSDVVRALYAPWADHAARVFQSAVVGSGLYTMPEADARAPGTCLLFSDGLRLDLGHRLADTLRALGLTATVETHLAALPTITATAKPALAPLANPLQAGPGLEPTIDGLKKVNAAVLREALVASGYQTLASHEVGESTGHAWTELSPIDSDGHERGIGMAPRVQGGLDDIASRVKHLLEAGWNRVEVVTDHGFLLLPGGLDKATLPAHLVEHRKGRCARLGSQDEVDYDTVPWRWDPGVQWAIAPGTSCFKAGEPYEHGGVSLPECVVPRVVVTRDLTVRPVSLERPKWSGMRMSISISGSPETIDIRTKPGDPTSSLLAAPVPVQGPTLKILIDDPDAEGAIVAVVALGGDGNLLGQISTTVGEM